MDRIAHDGTVERVEAGRVYVTVTSQTACGACKARSACGMSEEAHKIIEVHTADAANYHTGEAVTVSVSRHVGATAVVLAYVGPLVVLTAGVVVAHLAGLDDGLAALTGLAATGLYFVGLWGGRRRLEKRICFTIEKA